MTRVLSPKTIKRFSGPARARATSGLRSRRPPDGRAALDGAQEALDLVVPTRSALYRWVGSRCWRIRAGGSTAPVLIHQPGPTRWDTAVVGCPDAGCRRLCDQLFRLAELLAARPASLLRRNLNEQAGDNGGPHRRRRSARRGSTVRSCSSPPEGVRPASGCSCHAVGTKMWSPEALMREVWETSWYGSAKTPRHAHLGPA